MEGGGGINIFCVLNRVRVSLSRPNPPTRIPVEYTPFHTPRGMEGGGGGGGEDMERTHALTACTDAWLGCSCKAWDCAAVVPVPRSIPARWKLKMKSRWKVIVNKLIWSVYGWKRQSVLCMWLVFCGWYVVGWLVGWLVCGGKVKDLSGSKINISVVN